MKVIDKLPSTLVIDRSRWARGGRNGPPAFLNDQGARCCLGFLAQACGLTDDECRIHSIPGSIQDPNHPMVKANNERFDTISDLLVANDHPTLRESVRERRIKRGMKALGVTVTFVDGEVADGQ